LASSSPPASGLWDELAAAARRDSELWAAALLPAAEPAAVFSPLGEERFALGLETIYEGYLVHYGRPRLFAPADRDTALLLGDYLYARGLARVAAHDDTAAVLDLAQLISLCAQLRGDRRPGDGEAWAATAALLGRDELDAVRTALRDDGDPGPLATAARAAAGDRAVARALAAHARLLG
jgi:hypothetical protein